MATPAEDVAATAIQGSARVTLGHSQLVVRPIGLGCMGMSQHYGPADDEQSIVTLRTALDSGVNFLDTSDVYGAGHGDPLARQRGFGHNEELIGKAIKGRRDEVVIGTKFGSSLAPDGIGIVLNNTPDYIRSACEASLRRLGVDTIDLYYCHRMDYRVPIEETVGAMSELAEAGKVRAIGLSEVAASVIRRAHAVHPLTALQSEYSLWERGLEAEVIPTLIALGITLVPFSPLGRSALTGAVTQQTAFEEGDFRATNPRFAAENLAHNLEPVGALLRLAEEKGCQPGQLALAWLLAQPHTIVPIPGTKRAERVKENAAATNVAVSADEIANLSEIFAVGRVRGARYAPHNAVHLATLTAQTSAEQD